jgi:hypothetical protein
MRPQRNFQFGFALLTLGVMLIMLILMLSNAPQTHAAAPDPLPAGVQHVGTVYNVAAHTTEFFYAVTVAPTPAAAPDCSADLRLVLCSRAGAIVQHWPNWSRTANGVKLSYLPQGTTEFSVLIHGTFSESPITYTLTVDGTPLPEATTIGPQCTTTYVYFATLSARPIGVMGWLFR